MLKGSSQQRYYASAADVINSSDEQHGISIFQLSGVAPIRPCIIPNVGGNIKAFLMIKSLTVSEWIHERLVADQTSIVWAFLDNAQQQANSFNSFFAWNSKTDLSFETQFHLNEYLYKETDKIKTREYEFQKLINSHVDNGQFIYKSQLNQQLIRLLSDIESLKREYQQKVSERAGHIQLFRNHVVWHLLDCKELAQLFIDYGLPMVNVDDNFWWGHFGNYNKQEMFFSRFEKLKVNPLDHCKIIASDLRQTLLYYGDLPSPSVGSTIFNADSFYKRLKEVKETKLEKEVRSDYSSGTKD